MHAPVDILQERADRHFKSLARMRENSGYPVFAMEHGLSVADIDRIKFILRSRRKAHSPQASDWLLWVIYATEVGYDYTGEEYWHSFEEQTPGWEFQDRNKIKAWFRKFQRTYSGVIPSGRWANHFTIITWPITHAILPVYLQRQFARALYDLRYRLAAMATLDPSTIGRLLAVNVHLPGPRFREFCQQEELVGRIVLALLGEEPSEGKQPIYPPTLQRIVADLDKVRSSREWLKETRLFVSDRFKGIGRGARPPIDRPPDGSPKRSEPDTSHLAIRPKVLLRHTGGGSWSVLLDVPSFRNVSTLNDDVHSFLKKTRCRLNGGKDMKPRGWLLSGNRKGVLQSWPDTAKPLIQLEEPHPTTDLLLEAECRLSPGPIWLFRIGIDGTAWEIMGHTVRPGCSYIVVTTREPPQAHEHMSLCNLNCDGVKSFRLAIPLHVSSDMTSWLGDLGLQVARTIRVWPTGLPGRGWDGEGSSEWLTTEAPCFGVSHDHPVDAYTLRLNDGSEILIQTDGTGAPLFVRLAPLLAGIHSLTVKARRSHDLEAVASSTPAEGFVQLTVREPEPWTPGVASHPGLIVTIDPSEPDLDMFWRNETRLSVIGPEGYAATLTVKLEAADGHLILMERVGAPFDLPITPEKWRRSFEQFLQRKEYAWSYLEAATGTLIIDGATLGSRSIVFEHDVEPVRWLARRSRNDILVRLVDDTGQEGTEAKVYFCSMERPLEMLPLAPDKALSGLVVDPPGSLFFAEHAGHLDTVVVGMVPTGAGLQSLGFFPSIAKLPRNPQALTNVLRLLARWQEARLSGFLINIRHRQVIDGILAALYESLCGQNWAEAEAQFRRNSKLPRTLENLKARIGKSPGFAAVLARNRSNIEENSDQRTLRFSDAAARYKVCKDRKLCEFALRLASQPEALSVLPVTELNTLFSEIESNPEILRGARLLALLTASHADGATTPALPGWQW